MPRSKALVQQDLEPYNAEIVACVRQALRDYTEQYVATRHVHSKRSQATILHDHIVHRLREKFGTLLDAEGDLAVHSKGNLNQLIFKHGLLKMRLKKFDRRLRTRNVQTQAVIAFKWQQGSFEQTPEPTNLLIGYKFLDDAAVSSAEIWVTCPDGERVGWSWELSAAETAGTAAPIAEVLPFKQTPRVRPKRPAEGEADAETSKAEGGDAGNSSE